jgi:Serine dehydratase beta chain
LRCNGLNYIGCDTYGLIDSAAPNYQTQTGFVAAIKRLIIHERSTEKRAFHANALRFIAYREGGLAPAFDIVYYSIGGGFIVQEEVEPSAVVPDSPYPITDAVDQQNDETTLGQDLLALIYSNKCAIHSARSIPRH